MSTLIATYDFQPDLEYRYSSIFTVTIAVCQFKFKGPLLQLHPVAGKVGRQVAFWKGL